MFSWSFHFYLVNAVWVLRFIHRTSHWTSAPGAPLSFLDSKDDSLPRRPRGRIPSAMYRDGRPQMRNDRNERNDVKWWIKKFDCDQSVSWHSMVSLIQNHRSRMVRDGQGWWTSKTVWKTHFARNVLPGPSNWTLRWPSWDAANKRSNVRTTPTGPQIGDSKTCQQMLLTSWQVEFLARLTSVHSLLHSPWTDWSYSWSADIGRSWAVTVTH